MRILWLSNIMLPEISKNLSLNVVNGGGWISGLLHGLMSKNNIELTVCFPMNSSSLIEGETDGFKYYGFPRTNYVTKYDIGLEKYMEKMLSRSHPDFVHIFGTEYPQTLAMVNVCEKLGLINKVIVNIQGLISVYAKHYNVNLPLEIIHQYTLRDLVKHDNIARQAKSLAKRGEFEVIALKKVQHVIGRTDWDLACVTQINPSIQYHFCNETLRDEFYKYQWDIHSCEHHSIFVSQSNYPIKGFHFLLEAMPSILKEFPDTHIYTTGKNPLLLDWKEKLRQTYYHKYIGILIHRYHLEKKITFLGSLNEQQMCDRFLKSHIFISPSSIENSPNSVGEAMILGVPTISSDVGGVKNMLTHNQDGYIYPADEPYMMLYYIEKIFQDDNIALHFSDNAKKHAHQTHDREKNLKTMLSIYKDLCNE